MMSVGPPAWLAPLLLLLASGCAGGESSTAARSADRDSAGTGIIDVGPIPDDLPVWQPTGVLVDIGEVDGEAPYILDRVASAVRLDDRRIAVIDGGSSEIRLFDADGRFLTAFGGEGDGPGRFNLPRGLWQHHDSLIVWDVQLRRTTVFPLDGGDPRVIVPLDVQINVMTDAYRAGDVLVATSEVSRQTGQSTREVTARYITLPLDGGPPDTVATVDAGTRTAVPLDIQGTRVVAITQPVFSGSLLEASVGPYFLYANSATAEVHITEPGDTAATIVRWSSTAIPVTPDHVETHIRQILSRGGVESLVRGRLGGAGTAATFPRFGGLAAEPGHFWVLDYTIPGQDRPGLWTRFSFDGTPVARIALPADVTLLQAGPDFALVRRSDDLGVQHVVLLRIGPPDIAPG
jgi:hypothetical protein